MVRIRLPKAVSLQTIGSSVAEATSLICAVANRSLGVHSGAIGEETLAADGKRPDRI
jgi:hypothetical protein